MKYLITKEQSMLLKEEVNKPNLTNIARVIFEKQVKKGEQPHLDKMILNFFDVNVWSKEFNVIAKSLRNFIGREESIKLTEELLQQTFNTNRYNFSGGYIFDFKVTPRDTEEGEMWVDILILKGGTVELIAADNEVLDIDHALADQSFGWEIENEMKEIIDEALLQEVTYNTGIILNIETVKLED